MAAFLPQLAEVCANPTPDAVNAVIATIRGNLLAAYACAPVNGMYHRANTLAPVIDFFRDRGMYDGDNNPVIDASLQEHSVDRAHLMYLIAMHGKFRSFIVPFQRLTNNTMGSPLGVMVNALTRPLHNGCNMYAMLWAALCAVFATLEPASWLVPSAIPTVSAWFIDMTIMAPATLVTRLPMVLRHVGHSIRPLTETYTELLQQDFFIRMTQPTSTFLGELVPFVVKVAQDSYGGPSSKTTLDMD